ncbi:hypothetical protein dqs_0018 [Azoarcus olearius]|nr:hypothetical protein dqs_0018 [Azoarcus olearius]
MPRPRTVSQIGHLSTPIPQGSSMSTKASLKYCVDEASGASAHLYEECLAPEDFPVFLELDGLTEMSVDVTSQGTNVTVAIPRQLAVKLGLLRPPGH